jgi:Transcription factor WhiB
MTTAAARTRAAEATHALTMGLLNAAARGDKIPCGDYSVAYLFLSEHKADRQIAMRLCRPCVVKTECLEAAIANNEVFTVRGGRDFSRTPGRKKVA